MPDLLTRAEVAPRWLDPDATAHYIGVRVHELPRLRKAGKIPAPSLHLGPRTPRYDRLALDRAFGGDAASSGPGEAVNRAIQEIEAEGRTRRTRQTPRRHREGIPISRVHATQGASEA